jgi:hypothetical protein
MKGGNLTYMPISRSLPIKMDQHKKKRNQRRHLQSHVYITKNTHPKVNKSNIETSDNNMCYGIKTWKQKTLKLQYV